MPGKMVSSYLGIILSYQDLCLGRAYCGDGRGQGGRGGGGGDGAAGDCIHRHPSEGDQADPAGQAAGDRGSPLAGKPSLSS